MAASADTELIMCWYFRIIYLITFCTTLCILIRRFQKQKNAGAYPNDNIYQKLLKLWSFLAMISIQIMPLCNILATINLPYFLCHRFKAIAYISWVLSRIFVTFYQMARLQYCFLNKQIHSKQYGYPKYLFYILYLLGGIVFGLILFLPLFVWNQ